MRLRDCARGIAPVAMGVAGLWVLLSACGRRIPLTSLHGHILAVDTSLWMMQLIKGLTATSTSSSRPLPQAFLLSMCKRIIQLLSLGIRPVFVFDGPAPALKRITIAKRLALRNDSNLRCKRMAQQILLRQMALKTINEIVSGTATTDAIEDEQINEDDLFIDDDEEEDEEEEDDGEIMLPDGFDVNDAEAVAALPYSMQYELMTQMREHKAGETRIALIESSSTPSSFSQCQMKEFLALSAFNSRVDTLRANLSVVGTEQGQDTHLIASQPDLTYYFTSKQVEAKRVRPARTSQINAHWDRNAPRPAVDDNAQRADWDCGVCCESNMAIRKRCSRCGHTVGEEVSEWSCAACNCRNYWSSGCTMAAICLKCGRQRKDESDEMVPEVTVIDRSSLIDTLFDDDDDESSELVVSKRRSSIEPSPVIIEAAARGTAVREKLLSMGNSRLEFYRLQQRLAMDDTKEADMMALSLSSPASEPSPPESLSPLRAPQDKRSVSPVISVSPGRPLRNADTSLSLSPLCAPSDEDPSSPSLSLLPSRSQLEPQSTEVVTLSPYSVYDDHLCLHPAPLTSAAPHHESASPSQNEVPFSLPASPSVDSIAGLFDDSDVPDEFASPAAAFVPTLSSLLAASSATQAELDVLMDAHNQHARQSAHLSPELIGFVQQLLYLFGIPFINAPAEAEAQCAVLESLGLVQGIITDDSDVFLFGAKTIYRNMFSSTRSLERYLSSEIDAQLGLDRPALISMAQLLGSDYTPGVHGIGIVNAIEIIHAFNNDMNKFREWVFSENDERVRRKRKRSRRSVEDDDDDDEEDDEDEEDMSDHTKKRRLSEDGRQQSDEEDEKDADRGNADGDDEDDDDGEHALHEFQCTHYNARRRWGMEACFPSTQVEQGYLRPSADQSIEPFIWGEINIPRLTQFAQQEMAYTEMNTLLAPLLAQQQGRFRQGRIDEYFAAAPPSNQLDVAAHIRSKRIAKAVAALTRARARQHADQ